MPDPIPDPPADVCANCAAPLPGAYCGACGQRRVAARLATRDVLAEARDKLLDLESGLVPTAWNLLVRPDQVVRDWLVGRRRRYTPPLRYFFTVVGALIVASLWVQSFRTDDPFVASANRDAERALAQIGIGWDMAKAQTWLGWTSNLVLMPSVALGTWIAFRPWKRTLAEHIATAAYLCSTSLVMSQSITLASIATGAHAFVVAAFGVVAAYGWLAWAIVRSFPGAQVSDRIGRVVMAGIAAFAAMTVVICALMSAGLVWYVVSRRA